METRRRRRPIVAVLGVALFVVVAAALAPTQVGGYVGYVIISGNSMEPGLHKGDLVLTWRSGDYAIGDTVAYRQPKLGYVIHRIVDFDGEHYTLQGDNNHFIDSYHPAESEIVGERWLRVPGAGKYLVRLREPGIAAAVIVLGITTLGAPFSQGAPQGSGKAPAAGIATRRRPPGGGRAMQTVRENTRDLAVLIGVAVIAFGLLAAAAFARPTARETTTPIAYEHSGAFDYVAPVQRHGIYDGTGAETGDPIYTQLSETVAFTFDYRFSAQADHTVAGSIRLDAEVTSDGGWTRTIPLAPATPFDGASTSIAGELILDEVAALVKTLEEETGVVSRRYGLNVVATVDVEGTVGGVPLSTTTRPSLAFDLEPGRMSVSRTLLATGADPFAPAEPGDVAVPAMVPATLPILGAQVQASTARAIGLAGVGIFLLLGAALALVWAHARHLAVAEEADDGVTIVTVQAPFPRRAGPMVDLESFEDLVRIAARHDGVLLREDQDGETTFAVADRFVTYRYRTSPDFARHVPSSKREAA